jgi:hypothetical protein
MGKKELEIDLTNFWIPILQIPVIGGSIIFKRKISKYLLDQTKI